MTGWRDSDLDELRGSLLDRVEVLAETLLGAPSVRKPHTWRWGNNGSLVLQLHGRKRGLWFSHEGGEGGDPFKLIQHSRRCSFADAVAWARDWCGMSGAERRQHNDQAQQERDRQRQQDDADEATDQARRIAYARRLWDASSAAAGTIADRYLTDIRKIPRPASGWPDAVRFHGPSQSLILAATNDAGELQAVQRVRLTIDGHKTSGSPEAPTKQTNGVLADAVVRLPGDALGPLLLAEGPETGLSLWSATRHETWISLGSFAQIAPDVRRQQVICRDDDKTWSPADRKLRATLSEWRRRGINVVVATPWTTRRQDKSDFNDAIRVGGVEAVTARIAAALTPIRTPRRRIPVTEARLALDDAIAKFFDVAAAWNIAEAAARQAEKANCPSIPDYVGPNERRRRQRNARLAVREAVAVQVGTPPEHAIRVDVGAGKSTLARQRAAELLAALRARDDRGVVVIAVPTHRLGDDQAVEFEALPAARAANLKAVVWRGRERDDPDAIGETMCRDLDRVHDAQEALAIVQTSVCKKHSGVAEAPSILCPLFHACGYQRQLEREADVWIVAHESLFAQKPTAIGTVAAIIVDESAWQDGLVGANGADVTLSLDTLRTVDAVPFDPAGTDQLTHMRRQAFTALDAMPDGPVTRSALMKAGLTAATASDAYKLEWLRKVDPKMHPAMTSRERKAVVAAAAQNQIISKLGMFWRAVEAVLVDGGPAASGWAALGWTETKDGRTRCLVLKGRKPVRDGWTAPTLLLDATLDINLVRHHWPNVKLTADVAVDTPYQRIRQVTDFSYSKRKLIPWEGSSDKILRSGRRNLRDMHATVGAIGRQHFPGKVLAVVQLGVEEALPAFGPLPANVVTAHHNAIAGRDEWRDAAAQVVVGRTLPPPAAVERIAEALTGVAVTPLPVWYERACVGREMASGGVMEAEADRHPDPIAEAVRWRICEGELIQIIGRVRGGNRAAADPVDVLVMTDVPLPLPINEALCPADIAPKLVDLMLAAGGVAFAEPADAFCAYPRLWLTGDAARKAFRRAEVADIPVLEDYNTGLSGTSPLRRARYQVVGAGHRPADALIDVALFSDPRAKLGELLKAELAAFELFDPGAAAAEPNSPYVSPVQAPPEYPLPVAPFADHVGMGSANASASMGRAIEHLLQTSDEQRINVDGVSGSARWRVMPVNGLERDLETPATPDAGRPNPSLQLDALATPHLASAGVLSAPIDLRRTVARRPLPPSGIIGLRRDEMIRWPLSSHGTISAV